MKRILLLIPIILILLLNGCKAQKNSEISTSKIESGITPNSQNTIEINEKEIKDSLVNCKWLVTNVLDLNGNQSEITRLDLFGSIYKSLDGIKFYEDGRFTNNIGMSAQGEEDDFQGQYVIKQDKLTLVYDSNKTEEVTINQIDNRVTSLTIKTPFDYYDEDYIVVYTKFNLDEDYNEEKVHSEEKLLKENSGDKIVNNTSTIENSKKLKTNYLSEFFITEEDPSFETTKGSVHDNISWIKYGMDGKFYGFEDVYWAGCSVWCAIGEYTCNATASSTLAPQGKFSYEASNIINGNRKTTWIEGVDGYGIGEYVDITKKYSRHADVAQFEVEEEETTIAPSYENADINLITLCIVNGYAENMEKWLDNSRVKELKMYLNGKYITNIELEDTIRPQYIDINSLDLKVKSGEEFTLRFEIADIYRGDKYDDTAITGIELDIWTPNH